MDCPYYDWETCECKDCCECDICKEMQEEEGER